MKVKTIALLIVASFLGACDSGDQNKEEEEVQPEVELTHSEEFAEDPHSFSNPQEVVTKHLKLDLDVDFKSHTISGVARYQIAKKGSADKIIFDIDSIDIQKVTLNHNEGGAIYSIDQGNEFGQKLTVNIHQNTRSVNIYYRTSPRATALQWLRPEQTLGKREPFLFTQGQAILTRSWIPCQDSPGVRFTYEANVSAPSGLLAVMSAENPQSVSKDGKYHFNMKQAIPPYLISLAVGKLEFKAIDDKSGVYAEPGMLEAAAYELADTPKMIAAAESLYGPYLWERFDVIILPPSFPFGGMENPRLTFATPTIIAGDRSLTALIAHELAHSWSGNLVTNATWNDFWLNEGFTVYIEKRIMESLYGEDYAGMLDYLDYQGLVSTVEELGSDNDLTRLKLDLKGQDPDDGMTDIAYEKGYNFLHLIEVTVGRQKFDQFLKGYFGKFAFQSVSTEMFVSYLQSELLDAEETQLNVQEWVYGTGLPKNIVIPHSDRFNQVDKETMAWIGGKQSVTDMPTDMWTTHEWLHFIRSLPENLQANRLKELDDALYLTKSTNAEIQAAWFEAGIKHGYDGVNEQLEEFLRRVGRRKFLLPLYTALNKTPKGKELALRIYAQARPNYHSVSVRTIDELLDFDPEKYKGSISL